MNAIKESVSIFEFVNLWHNEGYGIALIDKETDIVITPYVDPSDYPTVQFKSLKNGTSSICGRYYLLFHSGCLELDKNYLNKKH